MLIEIRKNPFNALLRPVYSLAAKMLHARTMHNGENQIELTVPVISVGNIAFGGTAKTPTAEYLARLFAVRDYRPGIALRGFRGRIERDRSDPSAVTDGRTIYLDWKDSGDEARLLAENLAAVGIPVAVGRDRTAASKLLIDKFGVDLIILDDGFQYTSLKRDFDLVLIDTISPFGSAHGNDGPLREPVSALDRADAILLTRTEAVDDESIDKIKSRISADLQKVLPIFTARTHVRAVRQHGNGLVHQSERMRGMKVTAFAGIGNPLGFEDTVIRMGCKLNEMITFRDHHPYSPKDIMLINKKGLANGSRALVTTYKDAIRLDNTNGDMSLPLYIVDIELVIDDENQLTGLIDRAIKKH